MTTVDEARAALIAAYSGSLPKFHQRVDALIAAVRAEYEDVERLARAIRTAELKSQIDAEKHGAKPAELGPMPDWYRAYAADVWTAWKEAGR